MAKKEKRGRPPINDGLSPDQRYRLKNKRVLLLEPIEGSADDKADLARSLQVLEKHHNSRKAGVISAINHYAQFLEGE